jgi:hypothetical protein
VGVCTRPVHLFCLPAGSSPGRGAPPIRASPPRVAQGDNNQQGSRPGGAPWELVVSALVAGGWQWLVAGSGQWAQQPAARACWGVGPVGRLAVGGGLLEEGTEMKCHIWGYEI